MRNPRLKTLMILSGLIVLVVFAFSRILPGRVENSTAQQTFSDNDLPIVNVAIPPASVFEIINTVLKDQQFDRQNNIEVITRSVSMDMMTNSLVKNYTNVVVLSPIETARLNGESDDYRMIGPAVKMTCHFLGKKDSPIRSIEDLQGKKIGVLSPGTANYLLLELLYKEKGKDLSVYSQPKTGSMATLPLMLSKGDIDTMNICNLVTLAKMETGKEFFKNGSLEDMFDREIRKHIELLLTGLVVRKDWFENNQTLARSYLRAYDQTLNYLHDHPEYLSSDKILNSYQMTRDESSKLIELTREYNFFDEYDWNKMIPDILGYLKIASRQGMIPEKVDQLFVTR